MAAEAAAPPVALSLAVRAKLTADELKAVARVRWHDRLTSLWAPVTVLAIVFLPYLVIVESAECAYLWLQPPMQGLAVLAMAWWAALVVARFALLPWSRARKLRTEAEETLAQIEGARGWGALKERAREELVEATTDLLKNLTTGGKPLSESVARCRNLDEKHLSEHRRPSVLEVGGGFTKALAIALLVRAVLLEPYKIPSGSMIPTLEIGDQIFVNKFIYGVRIPAIFGWRTALTNTIVPFVLVRAPKRGDVIVFENPVRPEVDYIKRVVAIAGDTVEFQGRDISINGQKLATREVVRDFKHFDQRSPDRSVVEWVKSWPENDWTEEHPSLQYEALDGKEHYILYGDAAFSDGSLTVPPGHVFVMGDNRDNSLDGRFGLGGNSARLQQFVFVPMGNIKGKATVVWLPLGHDGWLSGVFGGTGFRFDRLFLPLTMCKDELPRVK